MSEQPGAQEVLYALYSKKKEPINGSSKYESLDRPGEEVIVTGAFKSKELLDERKQEDDVYQGRVGRWICKVTEPRFPEYKIGFPDPTHWASNTAAQQFRIGQPSSLWGSERMYPIMIPFVVDKRPFYAVRSEKQILKTGIYYWFESIDNPGERVAASMYFHPGLPLDPADTRKDWDDIVELGQVGKLIEMIDLNEIFPAPKYHTQIDIEEVD